MGQDMHIFQTFRESQKLSQTELGVLLGIPEDTAQGRISHYETGRRAIPVDVAHRFIAIAQARGEAFSLESVYPAPADPDLNPESGTAAA